MASSTRYEPAAQLVHDAACSSAAYVPNGHTEQGPAEAASVRYVPACVVVGRQGVWVKVAGIQFSRAPKLTMHAVQSLAWSWNVALVASSTK